jgi:TolB-like protein/DNA-binding winged helix-turn-helix (wHTH) protein/Flp pilus assembly protein TadD
MAGQFFRVAMVSPPLHTDDPLRLGDGFVLDPSAYELRRSGRALKLERIPMELLLLLVEERGHLVSRDRIVERVWGKDVFLDTDNSINAAIRKIRQVLKDDPEQPRFVQTVTGRGYRFIAPVTDVRADATEQRVVAEPASDPPDRAHRSRSRVALTLTVLGLAALATVGLVRRVGPRPGGTPNLRSIVVLPLDNLSGDASQDYFVDGMTDALTTNLAKIGALRVISRTSAMRYKGTKKGAPEIARELNVDGIIEGSVVRAGERVRVTAQLIHAGSDRHLWAETYERDLGDVLRLQSEVAQAIAQQVRVQLTPQQQARLRSSAAVNPEAYDAYLRGLPYINGQAGFETGRSYFEESIRKDPGFAPAYVRLADTYVVLGLSRQVSPKRAYGSAMDALRKGLALDASVAEAHTTLAVLHWFHEWDWAGAAREFDQSVELAPNYAFAHSYHANFLAWGGHGREAAAEIARARELDPGLSFAACESSDFLQLRDWARLVEASRRAAVSDPNDWLEFHFIGMGLEALGRPSEAIAEYQKAAEMSNGDQDPVAGRAHALAVMGRRAEAEAILRDLQRNSKNVYPSPYLIAAIHAGLGQTDKAFEWLERAFQEHSWDIAWQIKADPRIDNLRSDPRFQSLLRRAGL